MGALVIVLADLVTKVRLSSAGNETLGSFSHHVLRRQI